MADSPIDRTLNRRRLLGGALAAATAGAVAPSFSALAERAANDPASVRHPSRAGSATSRPTGLDYGPLVPVKDQTTGLELLMLPRGFEYLSYGWTGDPMADGTPTPGAHDGMAAFRDGDLVRLVRNHERGNGAPFSGPVYDAVAAGGTTNLLFDPDAGAFLETSGSLSGTIRNCAGGPTPWGSWLSCEETTQINGDTRHGYVFEVPADGVSDAAPRRRLGRFSHEAVAIDPATGIVYLTEDTGNSGFYRFVPDRPGDLTEGVLEMMAIDGHPSVQRAASGERWSGVRWVRIAQPDPGPAELSTAAQGFAQGGTAVSRGEGIWYGNGLVYFVSTSGGPVGQGQVFAYEPAADTLTVLFASPSADVLNAPDNICVSPRGGLVLCEDGGGLEFLHGLTPDGRIFRFAQNNVVIPAGGVPGKTVSPGSYTGSEWCGATFEPKNGNWLFANLQSPGITVAITGPWRKGAL